MTYIFIKESREEPDLLNRFRVNNCCLQPSADLKKLRLIVTIL
jgi:hypothetical protein